MAAIKKVISEKRAIGVIIILHLVGLVGLQLESTRSLFESLTPANLIITSLLVFVFHPGWKEQASLYIFSIAIAGFVVEVVGVHTGSIFGVYYYEDNLGLKLLDVPIIIGLNWALLVYCCGVIANKLDIHHIGKTAVGATLMVLLDVVIEPFAITHHLWQWEGFHVPIQNYLAWWLIAFIMLAGFYKMVGKPVNRVAVAAYVVMGVFFVLDGVF